MINRSEELKKYLIPGKHVHLVGIGGVSMRPLGLVLKDMGMLVTGSDMNSSVSTEELIAKGIHVEIGHRAENIVGACCIIRTAAAHNDNPEIAAARVAGIPVFERAEAWGVIMQAYRHAVCVAGTHGKTTTTSMLAHVLMAAQLDPTVMIGGFLPLLGAGHRVGGGDTILLESCEYCDSFLNFFPSLAIILNIEADHLDYFKDLEQIQTSFRRFAALATDHILVNGDDANTLRAVDGLEVITFGFGPGNRIRGVNPSIDWRNLDVECDGKLYCHLELSVIGKHNALNALAAMGAAWLLGIEGSVAAESLRAFRGADRRMQHKGVYNGADIYDDYAHHPGELAATIEAVRAAAPKRLVVAFQPHTYTRTKALFDDFVRELRKADVVILAEIYAARERNTIGISSRDLQAQIPSAIYCETLPEVTEQLKQLAQPGDVILTIGAGDIYRAGEALLK
jgi:UDP-N-acetylmuramate--alanine ligase